MPASRIPKISKILRNRVKTKTISNQIQGTPGVASGLIKYFTKLTMAVTVKIRDFKYCINTIHYHVYLTN